VFWKCLHCQWLSIDSKHSIYIHSVPCLCQSDNSLDENNIFLELRTTHWKISDKDLTDAGPSNANINLEQKFGNIKKCHHTISGEMQQEF
jgi:hypothetical protein